jgi:hypothetical protein
MVPLQANFFLITFRIFFWSNFLGKPCTVVKVLRPLRSVVLSAMDNDGHDDGQKIRGNLVTTYVEYEYGCSLVATAWLGRCLHPLPRTGLWVYVQCLLHMRVASGILPKVLRFSMDIRELFGTRWRWVCCCDGAKKQGDAIESCVLLFWVAESLFERSMIRAGQEGVGNGRRAVNSNPASGPCA